MNEEQRLSAIALKQAIKLIKIKSKTSTIDANDVVDVATTFYRFLKQK